MKRLLSVSCLVFCLINGAAQNSIWVSPDGDDASAGTEGQPVASLQAALERVRRLPGTDTVFVRVAPGLYLLNEPVCLTSGDTRPVVFEGDASGKPEISGGIAITGWETTPEGWWKCRVPEVVRYGVRFEQLFVNGQRAVRARTPDAGWFLLDRWNEVPHDKGTAVTPSHASQNFYTDPANLASLKSLSGAEAADLVVTLYHGWDITRKRVDHFRTDSGLFCFSGKAIPSYVRIDNKTRFVLENYKGALSVPGEWFLSSGGELFYIPREGEKIETAVCYAPVLEQLLIVRGTPGNVVKNKTFRNLSFLHSAYRQPVNGYDSWQAAGVVDAAIRLDWAENILFEDCEVKHTGNYAVWFHRACHNNTVRRSFLYDLGAGGIKIGELQRYGDNEPVTGNTLVENNIIRRAGMVIPSGIGVGIFHSADNRVLHNEIADLRYTGVSVGWFWGYNGEERTVAYTGQDGQVKTRKEKVVNPAVNNEIAYNHIHHIGWGELSDMGAVYTLGESPGTTIHNNVVHDIYSYDYGGWGLYTDEGSTGIVLENNLVYGCKSGGFHQHYGRDNIIRNNIFAFGHNWQLQLTRVEPHRSFAFSNNIVLMDRGPVFQGPWDEARIDREQNCYWNLNGEIPPFKDKTFKAWKEKGEIAADPLFVDPVKADFSFKSNRTIRKINFVPFDPSKAGVYGSQEWIEESRMPQQDIEAFKALVRDREKEYSVYYR